MEGDNEFFDTFPYNAINASYVVVMKHEWRIIIEIVDIFNLIWKGCRFKVLLFFSIWNLRHEHRAAEHICIGKLDQTFIRNVQHLKELVKLRLG